MEPNNPVNLVGPVKKKSSLAVWLQAVRPFSFTASMTPVLLGAAMAVYLDAGVRWWLLPLVIIASLSIHAATNLVSDWYDYRKGIDAPDTFGGSRILVDRLLSPKQILIAGLALFALTAAIGLCFIWLRGLPILIIGVLGLLGGFFYSLSKKLALGEVSVFFLMGPLMTVGSFFVLTGDYSHYVLFASLPVACLVAAILAANNLRDIAADTLARVRTPATIFGYRFQRLLYTELILSAFFLTGVMAFLKVLPVWSLLTLLSFPQAVSAVRKALTTPEGRPDLVASLDVQTAKLHLLFGVLLIVSLLIGASL
jgi:1,4-dihydroxy-2-naphthoate octaprenyltransferase